MVEIFKLCGMITEKDFVDDENYYNLNFTSNIKFDGERIMAKCENGEVILINRNKRSCNGNFPEIVDELKKIKGNFIIDGEIISKDDDFNKLQKRALTKDKNKQKELIKEIPVCYMIFDILKFEDINCKNSELKIRIEKLKEFEELIKSKLVDEELIKVAEFLKPKEMYEKAKKENREGIIIKRTDYTYREGRFEDWKKLKFFEEEELEVISYTKNNAGIRVEDSKGRAIQINKHNEDCNDVADVIDKEGKAIIIIQFLEKTADDKYRFPSFRGIKKLKLNDEENENE